MQIFTEFFFFTISWASESDAEVAILLMRFLKISSLFSARSSKISLSLNRRSLKHILVQLYIKSTKEADAIGLKKQFSLEVVLHLREELCELLADFLPDLCLNERVLRLRL